jgi:hypothetical protein
VAAALLGAGPTTIVTVQGPDGNRQVIGGPERQQWIDQLTDRIGYARRPRLPC